MRSRRLLDPMETLRTQIKTNFVGLRLAGKKTGYLVVYHDYASGSVYWVAYPEVKDLTELSKEILKELDGRCNSSTEIILNLSKTYKNSDTGLSEPMNELLTFLQRGQYEYPGNK